MQIRELDLKELDIAYEVVAQFYKELSYKEFEDTIYDMRETNYKMLGVFQRGTLCAYAGVEIRTNLLYGRHLELHEVVTGKIFRERGYAKKLLEYIFDYAKIAMSTNIVTFVKSKEHTSFLLHYGFEQQESTLVKKV